MRIPLEADAANWLPGGTVKLVAAFEMPEGLEGEPLRLGLRIADKGHTVAEDDRYTIALQNRGIDFSGGVNFFAAYEKTKAGYRLMRSQ